MDSDFGQALRQLREQRGFSLRELATRARSSKSLIHDIETGRRQIQPDVADSLDQALVAGGRLAALARPEAADEHDAEVDAIELLRRVTASDVSSTTLNSLESSADKMAMAYSTTPPARLLPRVSRHLAYVTSLVDARMTLGEHRRLIVVGGWLSLLRATLHIDLRQDAAADAFLDTAAGMADEAGHREIAAWCHETRAWDALTSGDLRQALALAQTAQEVAPRGSSAYVQATAQEGRVRARLGDRSETSKVLTQVERLAAAHARPDHPEHHYQYDPAKAHTYVATTLAWAADPAAEQVARDVIVELVQEDARPRRIASAHLDLAMALLADERPDEAAGAARTAIGSGRIVQSNWWRVEEIVSGVQAAGSAEAGPLRDLAAASKPS